MKVKAIRKGFDNKKIREAGDVFEMNVKKCPSWCEQVQVPKQAKKTAPKQDPAPGEGKSE